MLLRFLMLFVAFAATGGKGGAKKSGKTGAKKAATMGGQRDKAFEVLQDDLAVIAAAAGTTLAGVLGEVPTTESMSNWQLARVTYTPTAAIVGNSLGTLNVRQMRAGAPIGTVATLLLATGTTYNAEVPALIPVAGAPVLLAGDVLDCQYVQTGAGLALPIGTMKAEIN